MDLARVAASSTVASLFAARARERPDAVAIEHAGQTRTYGALRERVARLAAVLVARGVGPGDRVAVLPRNRAEYLEALLAGAWLGAVVACQCWRLSAGELRHCLDLVDPSLVLSSPEEVSKLTGRSEPTLLFGPDYERALTDAVPVVEPAAIDPEAGYLILYTSGTTGLPKGAVISHRALVARNVVTRAELHLAIDDAYVAWSPLYHMGGAEYPLGTLMSGGAVYVVDGFDPERLATLVAERSLEWLLLMPGMVGRLADVLEQRGVRPRDVNVCGVMADLVPPADLARITRLLEAPYANTFGATETGNPPCSAGLVPIGVSPARLSKTQSAYCEVRLVDEVDRDVPDGAPGELLMRGPTLFSGYWNAPDDTARDFRGGWFHMGDVFVRNDDGTLDLVDRRKYLIKSGGENIYPAEIERVLLQDERVAEVAVVRRRDERWGEVPVAFVASRGAGLTPADLAAACEASLASFKTPKAFHFIDVDAFPRSASGKIQRHELERRLEPGAI